MNNFAIKIILLLVLLISLYSCSSIQVYTVKVTGHEIINNTKFIKGMSGCENIYLSTTDLKFYVSDLNGYLYFFDIDLSSNDFKITNKIKLDFYVLGITKGIDGSIYVATSSKKWLDEGGVIIKINEENNIQEKVSDYYPGINGLTSDSEGNLYFTAGNMSFLQPNGAIYIIKKENNEFKREEILADNLKSPNGLYYDRNEHTLAFTEVFTGTKEIDLEKGDINLIFGKTRIVEGFDDLCKDRNGNYWVADPPNGAIKMYNPIKKEVIRFVFEEFGIASSCKIRVENGEEMLYITEIKQSNKSKEYDGRGVLILPINQLFDKIK